MKYWSHDEGGQLTEAVRRHPHAVVLFDEVGIGPGRIVALDDHPPTLYQVHKHIWYLYI